MELSSSQSYNGSINSSSPYATTPSYSLSTSYHQAEQPTTPQSLPSTYISKYGTTSMMTRRAAAAASLQVHYGTSYMLGFHAANFPLQ